MSDIQVKPLWSEFSYKPHQITAVEWMVNRESMLPSGGILCDEMGLGKTIEVLGLIKSSKVSNTLIIAPVAVLDQWASTAIKSSITVMRCKSSKMYNSWEVEGPNKFMASKIYLIGYESALRKRNLLSTISWDRIICDEAHRLASANSYFTLVNQLVSKSIWLLSATPIVNGMKDLKHLFELLRLDDAEHVVNDYEKLSVAMKQCVLARSMDQLRASIPDAPPKPSIETRRIPFLDEDEAEFYRGITGGIVKKWKALEADAAGTLQRLQLFMKLRQLSLHPQVYIESRKNALGANYKRDDWAGSSTKFDAIRATIEGQIGEEGVTPHKWIIFCHFLPEMKLLESMLKAQEWCRNVYVYNGSKNHDERAKIIENSHIPLPSSKQTDVILVQLQSGGTGLNLQHFDRIIFTGPWWTSALMEQAIGRAVRIGQKEVVKVYNFILEEEDVINIDTVIREKAEEKGCICKQVLELATNTV